MLTTERLILRRWEDSDAGDLYEYAKDPDIGPIAGWPVHKTVEESLDAIRNVLKKDETYAICLKCESESDDAEPGDALNDNGGHENGHNDGHDGKPGRVIGSIGLKMKDDTDYTDRDDECEMGFWIGKSYWGQGMMPEAAKELLRHAFEDIGMRCVWCGYYDGNTKSKRVQEKCGFRYQWTAHDVDVTLLHEKRTEHVNRITKEEWLADNAGK